MFVYRFYKILVIEPTTEVKAERIGAPSVKEIEGMPSTIKIHVPLYSKASSAEHKPRISSPSLAMVTSLYK
jgi:hypothetical protein